MDYNSHLTHTLPPSYPNPDPNPNPYSLPQPSDFVPYNTYQYHTTAAINFDPYNNASFHPLPQSHQPAIYAPPPATIEHGPLQQYYAAVSYYANPPVHWTNAVGQYELGGVSYAAANDGAVPPSSTNNIKSTQKNGTKKQKKMKVPVPHVWCEVCKIDCGSKDVFDAHRLGKKHKKNLKKLKASSIGPVIAHFPPTVLAPSPAVNASSPPVVATSPPLSAYTSAPVDESVIGLQYSSAVIGSSPLVRAASTSLPVSTSASQDKPISRSQESEAVIACSVPAFATSTPLPVSTSASTDKPINGTQASAAVIVSSPPVIATLTPLPVSTAASTDKPITGAQESHAVVASSPPVIATLTPLPVSTSASTDNPIIGPLENPLKTKVSKGKSSKKRTAASIEDIETKRRKLLKTGTLAEDLRMCKICNVVSNSEIVFNNHLAGRRHAKNLAASTGVSSG